MNGFFGGVFKFVGLRVSVKVVRDFAFVSKQGVEAAEGVAFCVF